MANLVIIVVFTLIILTGIMVVRTIIDIFHRKILFFDKILWTILIVTAPVIGSIIYYSLGKRST